MRIQPVFDDIELYCVDMNIMNIMIIMIIVYTFIHWTLPCCLFHHHILEVYALISICILI